MFFSLKKIHFPEAKKKDFASMVVRRQKDFFCEKNDRIFFEKKKRRNKVNL
jgi:hypothetical protein